jgi:hypothetical protein
MSNKMRGLAVSLAVLASSFAGAVPAMAVSVLDFTGVGGNSYGGDITTFPYYITVNGGPAEPMMCDDARTEISIGDSWDATANALTLADLPDLKFASMGSASTVLNDYEMAAYIESGVAQGTIASGDGNAAVWSIFDPAFNTSLDHSQIESILGNAQAAVSAGGLNYSGITIYTPSPLQASQEFIYGTVSFDPKPQFSSAPEPGTYAMLGGGLVLLAWIGRRRRSRA